jgi:magnesium chelatase accessory protein
MAARVRGLLDAMEVEPAMVAGHSAGAAILARLCLDRAISPAALVSLNGAFMPFGRMAAPVFSGAARMLASSPVVPYMVAMQGFRRRSVERLIEQTGSRPGRKYLDHYRSLVREPKHVAGALRMMASWDLAALWQDLPHLETPLVLVTCCNDLAVDPDQARRLARRVPGARLEQLPGLGHLGHEEDPAPFANLIRSTAQELDLLPGG